VLARLWAEAEARTPGTDVEAYTQGMMDLGANVCASRNPACLVCPVAQDCVARLQARVDELPGRKARRESKRKRIGMLVVLSRGEVLLEKRPPTGIWGGLWSLPEFAAGDAAEASVQRDWGFEPAKVTPLAPFEHAFTHFTLEVSPWRVEVERGREAAFERPATWLALCDLDGAALPSPVKKLLRSVA
jgi:A/G-specific adenine glycosylase